MHRVGARDGPIPVSVSEISAYRHFFQYRQYRYRQAKKVADTAVSRILGKVSFGELCSMRVSGGHLLEKRV